MPQNFTWKAQPLFISSTFTDMMKERDIILNFVIKELEERLLDRRVRLEPIDLRWGVETTSTKEKEHKELMVLKVCLDEIDRSEPYFIGIIGDRYGWIPPEKRMKDAENEKGFETKLKNKSVTALEIEYGVLANEERIKHSIFFFREPLPYDKMLENIRADYADKFNPEFDNFDAQKRVDDFKALIIKTVGKERVFYYNADWEGESVTGLEEFKEKVAEQLWRIFDLQTKNLEDKRTKTWEEEEQKYLRDFIEERTISFSGREDIINSLKQFSTSDSDNRGMCVTGESGLGKSALFAKLYKELENENVILLAHAAGISSRSNSLQNMLTIWIEEIAEHLKIEVKEQLASLSKFEDFSKLFSELLGRLAYHKRVVVLVDALNQFERTAHSKYVNWLPESIPANAKFIFTAISGDETENLTKRKSIIIQELKPVSLTEAHKIIEIICKRYHKKLNSEVIDILLRKKKGNGGFAFANPLWLTMAIDEFLLMDEDDFIRMKGLKGDAEQKLKQLLILLSNELPADIAGMYGYVFDRCKMFGEEFVNILLSYIAISRNGLRESDLEAIIKRFTKTEWDSLNFASFRRYLRNHIVRKGTLGLWDFRHVQARESLEKGLLKEEQKASELNRNLADHLEKLQEEDPIRLSEIIWHLFKCDDKKKVAEIYGSKQADNLATSEYSISLRDILLLSENNVDWVASLVSVPENSDSINLFIINNVFFNLDERIKNHIQLKPRIMIFQKASEVAMKLAIQYPDSYVHSRILSVSYNLIGDISQSLGDTKEALEHYEFSLRIFEIFYKRFPESVECSGDLSVSYTKSGDLYKSLGDMKQALKRYELSLKILEELCKRNPESAEYSRDLSVTYMRIGEIYGIFGDAKKALERYELSLKIVKELCKRYPESAEYSRDLSILYDRMGDIYKALGDTKGALEVYELSLQIREELRKRNPDSAECARDLSSSYNSIGDIYKSLGDMKGALEVYELSLQIREELCKKNPDSAEYSKGLSISYERIGEIYEDIGYLGRALERYELSLKILEKLCEGNPESAKYTGDLSVSYIKIGDIYEANGEPKRALGCYELSLRIIEELYERNPESAEHFRDLSVSYDRLGFIYRVLGDTKSSLASYNSSLIITEELLKRNPDSADYARDLVVSNFTLAQLFDLIGTPDKAFLHFEHSIREAEKLVEINPDSPDYKNILESVKNRIVAFNESLKVQKPHVPPEEADIQDLREVAERSFSKGNWEATETLFYKLIKKGDAIESVAENLFTTILNKRDKISDLDLTKLNDLIKQLEAKGHNGMATELRKKLEEKNTSPKIEKKGWKFWKK